MNIEEVATKVVVEQIGKIGSQDERHNQALSSLIRRSVILAFAEFSNELIVDSETQEPRPGVTDELVRRLRIFMSS